MTIELERSGPVATLRIRRPPVNALDADLLEALVEALDGVERSDARAVVIAGDGNAFSAGADLFRILAEDRAYLERGGRALSAAIARVFRSPLPVVAAINGHAIAGGCVLACACEHRVASRGEHRIGLAELRVGVPFPLWALEIVRDAVAPQHLRELVLLGRTYRPEDALALGLVDEVVDPGDLLARARDVATRLSEVPGETFRLTKAMLHAPTLARIEASAGVDDEVLRIWDSPETRAVIAGFLQRTFGAPAPAPAE